MTVPRKRKVHDSGGSGAKLCGDFGGKNRKTGKLCERPAGWGTDHAGTGKCKLHGGTATGRPPKHGLYSGRYQSIRRPRIKALLEEFENDDDPLDLLPEVKLLRALILDYVERYDEHTEALIAWHASFGPSFHAAYGLWEGAHEKWHEAYKQWFEAWQEYRSEVERVQTFYRGGWPEPTREPEFPSPPEPPDPAQMAAKPREVPDILSVGKFLSGVGGLVDRIHRQQQEGSITLDTLRQVLQRFGVEMYHGVQEAIEDESLRSAVLEAVESRWGRIDLPRPESSRNRGRFRDNGTEDGEEAS